MKKPNSSKQRTLGRGVSLPIPVSEAVDRRIVELSPWIDGFSAYVQELIRHDLTHGVISTEPTKIRVLQKTEDQSGITPLKQIARPIFGEKLHDNLVAVNGETSVSIPDDPTIRVLPGLSSTVVAHDFRPSAQSPRSPVASVA